ncbi:MAG: hypothetical protein E7E21_00860 [Peptostreptococcaceae bacterium]|nr:hypothetical protein [Peptostreptococcaceae bacterium]
MSFYQTNNKILSKSIDGAETIDFNKYPNLLDILFNHWISQKENYNRIKKEFNRGEFEISLKIIKGTFDISDRKARSLIKRFVEDEIIMLKRKGNSSSNKSIYIYLSALEKKQENEDRVSDIVRTQLGHSEMLKNEHIQRVKGHSEDTVSDIVANNSKKELIKRINKKDIYTSQCDELWKLYPNKKGKQKAYEKIKKLLEKYSLEELMRSVERYSKEVEGKNKQYIQHGSTFFNGGYVDYLDENYHEKPKDQQLYEKPRGKVIEMKIGEG